MTTTDTSTEIRAEHLDLVRREWAAFVDSLAPIGERMAGFLTDPADPQARQELYRCLIAEVATGYLGRVYADPRHPDFWPLTTMPAFNCYLNNPDDMYYLAAVDDDGVYRISGYRGTVKALDFQTGKGSYMVTGVTDEFNLGVTLANYDVDTHATVGEDGYFEVVLSPERPEGWTGDWWELHEGASNILSRQICYDWVTEVDGRFGIERLDVPAAKPRPTAEELADRIASIAAWAEGTFRFSAEFARYIRDNWENELKAWDLTTHLAFPTQQYVYGGFNLEPDEALVCSFQVPKVVGYWSIHLGDDLGFMIDWMHHQSIVNGHTAHVGADRWCHVVVSAQDPGVPNWLDTTGYRLGEMSLRWKDCDAFPAEHRAVKVKIDQVRDHVPSDEPTVSAQQREALVRRRRTGAQMRKRG